MSNPEREFSVQNIRAALERLRTGSRVLRNLDPDDPIVARRRRDYHGEVAELAPRIEQEWQQRLTTDRDANSFAEGITNAERKANERTIVERALTELVPLAQLVMLIRADIEREPAPAARPGAIGESLSALKAANWREALYALALAGDLGQAVVDFQRQREHMASDLLAEALGYSESTSQREKEQQYLDQAWRVGTESRRQTIRRQKERESGGGPPSPRRRPWLEMAIILIVLVLVLVTIVLQPWRAATSASAPTPTARPPAYPTALAVVSPTKVVPTPSPVPSTPVPPTPVPRTPVPRTPVPPTPVPPTPVPATPTSPATVMAIDPTEIFAGALPKELVIRGEQLDQAQKIALRAQDGTIVELEIVSASADTLIVRLNKIEKVVPGDATYNIQIDERPFESPLLTIRDYIRRTTVKGVKREYADRGDPARIAEGRDAFTTLRQDPSFAQQNRVADGQLRNGDEVDILREDVEGWYQVRIRRNTIAGWVERWLVDDADVPARLVRPLIFSGSIGNQARDEAVPCGTTHYESFIWGGVANRDGRGIGGAKLTVTSSVGWPSYTIFTNPDGSFNVPGLGCTAWIVRLISVPLSVAPDGIKVQNSVRVTNLNGARYSSAEVRFRQQ